jgi:TolB-like protein/Flp pilus assembly protein TadD
MRVEGNDKGEPSPEAVRGALQRLLSSRIFAQSVRLSGFLKFGVEAALAGRVSINEYSIGIDVFEKRSNFDPRIDPIVRVHARRLRSKLKQYYETEGSDDAIEIGLPLRTYVPIFRMRPKPSVAKRAAAFRPQSEPADSILVLPFTHLSPAREEGAYFAEGLTREVIHALSLVKEWRVVAWHAGNGEQRPPDLRELGRQLNVAVALWGTVRKAQKTLRISVELSSVPDGTVLWSQMYEVEIEDQVAAQERLGRNICQALRSRAVSAQAAPGPGTPSARARSLYLKGRHLAASRCRASLERSLDFLSSATAAEPQYAAAHSALAETLVLLATEAEYPPWEVMPKAAKAAARARECDPADAEARVALGLVAALYDGDQQAAETEFLRAIELCPAAASLAWYAAASLTPTGRFPEAIDYLERARELDPVAPAIGNFLAFAYCAAGSPERAVDVLLDNLTVDPDFPLTHWTLGIAYETQAQFEKAIESFERACHLSAGAAYTLAGVGHAHARAGNTGQAIAVLEELRDRSRKQFVPATDLAIVHLGLSEHDDVLHCLATAAEQRCPWRHRLAVDPRTRLIREDARFALAMRGGTSEQITQFIGSSITSCE